MGQPSVEDGHPVGGMMEGWGWKQENDEGRGEEG